MLENEGLEVEDALALESMPAEYKIAVRKVVVGHAINELVGARLFDEPSIQLAQNPVDKWMACRIATEEYGHHVRFARLAVDMGVDPAEFDPEQNGHLNIFDFSMRTWVDFVAIKAIVDLAEIIQVEDLVNASYLPLRDLSRRVIMPEEKFHVGFGRNRAFELVKQGKGAELQAAIDQLYPACLRFFGSSNSKNNALFRKFGIKMHTNDEMRAMYRERVTDFVERELGLRLPLAS